MIEPNTIGLTVGTNDLASKHIALEELRHSFDCHMNGDDQLDQKLETLLSATGIIVAIVMSLQFIGVYSTSSILGVVGIIVVAALLAGMFTITLLAMRPGTYTLPISQTWEGVTRDYFGKDENAALDHLISQYLYAEQHNYSLTNRKARLFFFSTLLFVAIIISLVMVVLLTGFKP